MADDNNLNAIVLALTRPTDVSVKGQEAVQTVVDSLIATYTFLPKEAGDTLAVLLGTYASQIHDERGGMPLTHDQQKTLEVMGTAAAQIAASVIEYLKEHVAPQSGQSLDASQATGLKYFADLVGIAMRAAPGLLGNPQAELILATSLGRAGNLANVISRRYFLGERAETIEGTNANRLMTEYFEGVGFHPTVADMSSIPGSPVELILQDWAAAVKYCMNQGIPAEAFTADGSLFKFAPDCIRYVHENASTYPGLDLLKVNDPAHVSEWLRRTAIGVKAGRTTHDNWLTLLTGYTPDDNRAIPGLYKRYNQPLVSTAINIGLNK